MNRVSDRSIDKPLIEIKTSPKRCCQNVYDQMTLSDLETVRDGFLGGKEGEDVGLSEDELCKVFSGVDAASMHKVFALCGVRKGEELTWGNYVTNVTRVLQLEKEMEGKAVRPLFNDHVNFIELSQRDEVVRIRFIPRLTTQSTRINPERGHYLMLGRTGTVTLWSLDMELLSTFTVGNSPQFFVDMVVLYPSSYMAATSAARAIAFYEMGGMRGTNERFSIVGLVHCVTCLDYWCDVSSGGVSRIVWGDMGGCVHVLQLNVTVHGCLFGRDCNKILTTVSYDDLLKGRIPSVTLRKFCRVHHNWVSSVRYLPQHHGVISASSGTTHTVCFSQWLGKPRVRYYPCSTSVLCLDYSLKAQKMVTGCVDCKILVWDLFTIQKPIISLKGHTAPIVHVALHVPTKHVISMDRTHAIKVFHYLDGTLLQSFSSASLRCMGRIIIKGFFFNPVRCQVIAATAHYVVKITKRCNPPGVAQVTSHDFPTSCLCYDQQYQQILTATCNAEISVWDLHTGKHVLTFRHHSLRTRFRELPWAVGEVRLEVTAMVKDTHEGCVVTGANDGTINRWNFLSGKLLEYYCLPETTLVTGLGVHMSLLYATGWCGKVYALSKAETFPAEAVKHLPYLHTSDINCMMMLQSGQVVTASYDGDVIVQGVGVTHFAPRRLNAALSSRPEFFGHTLKESKKQTRRERRQRPPVNSAEPVYDAFTSQYVSREESDEKFRSFESSVDVLLCLETRNSVRDPTTANIVTAGAEGWVRVWSLHQQGGLKGQFLATEQLGETVVAMATDSNNDYLFTGDSEGYLKTWDIYPYCNAAVKGWSRRERTKRKRRQHGLFVYMQCQFLKDEAAAGFERCAKYHKRPPPLVSNPDQTLMTPCLLNVFQAHVQAISALTFIDSHHVIVTAGRDCSVRLWTLAGTFIGHCGEPWDGVPESVEQKTRRLPRDVRRCASARTQLVVKKGRGPLWDLVANVCKVSEGVHAYRKRKQFEVVEDACPMTKPVLLDRGNLDQGLPEHLRLDNIVHFDWKDPENSSCLGKSYRPNMRHRHLSLLPSFYGKQEQKQVLIYRHLPISDVTEIPRIRTPQLVKDREQRRRQKKQPVNEYFGTMLTSPYRTRKSSCSPSLNSSDNPPLESNRRSRARRPSPSLSENWTTASNATRSSTSALDIFKENPFYSSVDTQGFSRNNLAQDDVDKIDKAAENVKAVSAGGTCTEFGLSGSGASQGGRKATPSGVGVAESAVLPPI